MARRDGRDSEDAEAHQEQADVEADEELITDDRKSASAEWNTARAAAGWCSRAKPPFPPPVRVDPVLVEAATPGSALFR
jgi:hypothetical protein